MTPDALMLLPLWYVAFLLSLTCHEAGHAWAAFRGGDSTAYVGGQVSLNPVPHMQREPFGTVLVPMISFVIYSVSFSAPWMIGWASAPYDPAWEDRYPRRAAAMAAAGPIANLILAALAFAVLKIGLAADVWQVNVQGMRFDYLVVPAAAAGAGGALDGAGRFVSVLFSLNVILFIFNLLPVAPLDGASILAGLFEPARRLRDAMRSSSFTMLLGLLIAWRIFPILLNLVFRPLVGLL